MLTSALLSSLSACVVEVCDTATILPDTRYFLLYIHHALHFKIHSSSPEFVNALVVGIISLHRATLITEVRVP